MKKMTPRQQKEAEEYIEKREVHRRKFLQEIANYKDKFKEYYFDKDNRLVLVFESFPYDSVNTNLNFIGCGGSTMYKLKPRVEVTFYFSFPKDEVDEWVIANRDFHNEMCGILGIKPTIKDRKKAQKKERKRLTKIEGLFETSVKENRPIQFTDIVSQETIFVTPGEMFDKILFVENPGQGFYKLHYSEKGVKTIFLDDGSLLVHGAKNSRGTCYDSEQEKNKDFKKRHKNTLFNGRLLVLSNQIMFVYFHYLMREHYRAMYSYEPKIEEAFLLGKMDYTNMNKCYSFKQVRKGFEQVAEIGK